MELRHLRYFVSTAEEGNVSRAAARLRISQPAISRQLRDLEAELGLRLFDRKAQGLTLTEDGETALVHARDLLRRANLMTAAFERRRSGPGKGLKVGFIPTALPGFLAGGMRLFNERQPATCVQIREMSPAQQEKALSEGDLDLALLGSPCPTLKRRFATATILKLPMRIVLPNHHLLALRKSVDLRELEGESFVSLHERNFPGRPQLLAELSEKAGYTLEPAMKADGLSEVLGLVAGGAGFAVLPADVDHLPHTGVVFVKMRQPRMNLTSAAAWRRDNEDPEIQILVQCLKDAVTAESA